MQMKWIWHVFSLSASFQSVVAFFQWIFVGLKVKVLPTFSNFVVFTFIQIFLPSYLQAKSLTCFQGFLDIKKVKNAQDYQQILSFVVLIFKTAYLSALSTIKKTSEGQIFEDSSSKNISLENIEKAK